MSDSETVVRPSIPASLRRPHVIQRLPSIPGSNANSIQQNLNNDPRISRGSRLPICVPPPRVPNCNNNNYNNFNNNKKVCDKSHDQSVSINKNQDLMYDSVSSSGHIYEMIGSERSVRLNQSNSTNDCKPKVPPRNMTTTNKGRKMKHSFLSEQSPIPANNKKQPPPPSLNRLLEEQTILSKTLNMPNILQPNVLKYFQQKLYQSFGSNNCNTTKNNPEISSLLPSVYNSSSNGGVNIGGIKFFDGINPLNGGNNNTDGNNIMVENRQQQIDMMLETAQFLATAAYLER